MESKSRERQQFETWFLKKSEEMLNEGETHVSVLRQCEKDWKAWQAGIAAGKVVAYMTHQGSAVSPDDFAGGEEEMHHSAKMEGWTPLIAGITVKGEGDEKANL